MKRPYIVCHMMTALDGKITGPYMNTAAIKGPAQEYERNNASYKPQAWLCGRVTTDENFTFYKKPALDEHAPAVPAGDYVAVQGAKPRCTTSRWMRPVGSAGRATPCNTRIARRPTSSRC